MKRTLDAHSGYSKGIEEIAFLSIGTYGFNKLYPFPSSWIA